MQHMWPPVGARLFRSFLCLIRGQLSFCSCCTRLILAAARVRPGGRGRVCGCAAAAVGHLPADARHHPRVRHQAAGPRRLDARRGAAAAAAAAALGCVAAEGRLCRMSRCKSLTTCPKEPYKMRSGSAPDPVSILVARAEVNTALKYIQHNHPAHSLTDALCVVSATGRELAPRVRADQPAGAAARVLAAAGPAKPCRLLRRLSGRNAPGVPLRLGFGIQPSCQNVTSTISDMCTAIDSLLAGGPVALPAPLRPEPAG